MNAKAPLLNNLDGLASEALQPGLTAVRVTSHSSGILHLDPAIRVLAHFIEIAVLVHIVNHSIRFLQLSARIVILQVVGIGGEITALGSSSSNGTTCETGVWCKQLAGQ